MACLVCLVIRPGRDRAAWNWPPVRATRRSIAPPSRRWSAPPSAGRPTSDVRKQRSCYRFSVTVTRIPPVPIVGCNFDEAALKASCYYPTKKVTRTEVKLESVDYDG